LLLALSASVLIALLIFLPIFQGVMLDSCVVAAFDFIPLICCLRLKRPLSLSQFRAV
jgi:hypothetical protein